jgi:hypothetical protein
MDDIQPSEAWLRCLELLEAAEYDQAFKLLLDSGDDLYLLRLMYKTGPDCYKVLGENTSLRLFAKVVGIAKSQFMNDLVLDFFLEACDSKLASQSDRETIEAMLMVLECIAKSAKNKQIIGIIVDYLKNIKCHN